MADDTVSEVIAETENKMKKAIDILKKDLAGIRTGRANPALVDRLAVEYYGVPTPLNQLANVSAPEPQLLVIQPWDKSAIAPIEKAILKSELGLTPTNDGRVIRLAIPRLSEERRRELVRLVRRRAEEGKVAIRNCRRDGVEDLKEFQKEKLISEDELKRGQERMQKLTDNYIEEIERLAANKEKEILEV